MQLAGDVDRREQHVAELVEALVVVAGGDQLLELVAHRLQRLLDALEVEAARGGAALNLARVQRPGQVLRHLAEDARLAPGLGRP